MTMPDLKRYNSFEKLKLDTKIVNTTAKNKYEKNVELEAFINLLKQAQSIKKNGKKETL